jgi:hypothetical protein
VTVATYHPTLPAGFVRQKLRHHRFLATVGAVIGLPVVVISAISSLVSPSPQFCQPNCGPSTGPTQISISTYTSSSYGYQVPYDASTLSIASQSATGVDFSVRGADPKESFVDFDAVSGSNPTGAVQQLVNGLDTNTLQGLRQIGAVPGAEIGEMQATGYAYQADYVPPAGGQSAPVDVVVMAATHNNLTIAVLAVGLQDQKGGHAPLYMNQALAQRFELSVTGTAWPGQP